MYRINGTQTWTGVFNYQENGDMTSRTISSSSTSFTYAGNEMATAGASGLDYDLNGNQTTSLKDASTSMTLEYNWDNKLRSAVAGANSIEIKYDPAGNRVYKSSVSSVSSAGASAEVPVGDARKYIVDVVGDLPVILMELETADSENYTAVKTYIYVNSEILSEHDGGSLTAQYYYLHDRLGSVRQVVTSAGSVAKMFTFNPFGETIESYGDFYTPWQFTGQYLDSETGQYYLRARQYSPYLSRFTGRDLIVGQFENPLTLHKYLYCQNEPVNRLDPMGLLYTLPGKEQGGDHDRVETRNVINAFDIYIKKYGVSVGAMLAFGPNNSDPRFPWLGQFDYGASGYTFAFHIGSSLKTLTGGDMGNYLAGRLYKFGGMTAMRDALVAGEVYHDKSSPNRTLHDSARSQYWIYKGALDANRELQKGLNEYDFLGAFALELDEYVLQSYVQDSRLRWQSESKAGLNIDENGL